MKQIKQPDTHDKSTSSGNFGTGALRINQTCLSLRERCRAATERAAASQHVLGVYPDTNLSARYPLSHLLCKCQLSQRESREAGANFLLLRTSQTCLSLRERCRAATERAAASQHVLGVYPDTNLSARYPLSHLLCKCQLSQRESQEVGANFLLLRTSQTCLSLRERCRAATERAAASQHVLESLP